MKAPAILLASTAGALLPNPSPHPDPYCKRTFTKPMFSQAARATYEGTRLPRRGAYGRLWRYAYCARPPFTTHRARLIWGRYLQAWAARRRAVSTLPYGEWAIPAAIVMCESRGQNLPPNSAGASGYYQIIPGTWTSYGGYGPAAYLAAKPEQDSVASRIWDGGAGAGQWVCKG